MRHRTIKYYYNYYYYHHYHYLCNVVLNCLLECFIGLGEGYVTAFFARLQFTTILLWCSEHHHHHYHQGQTFTSFYNYSVLPSLNRVYYYHYYYYDHHFIILSGTSQSLLIGLAALGNSWTVMGNSFVGIDVSMEISGGNFTSRKSVTQKTLLPRGQQPFAHG